MPAQAAAGPSQPHRGPGIGPAKALAAAAELGLADLLRDGPRTAASLAEICNVDADSLHRLLRALASVGVFVRTEPGSFALTPMADLLRSDRPDSMRALARMYGSEQYQAWGGLLDSVRDGCAKILRNCREAMLPAAKVLIIEQVIPPQNEPSLGEWLDLHMLVLLGGRERTEAQYASLLSTADLKLDRVIPATAGARILEATAA